MVFAAANELPSPLECVPRNLRFTRRYVGFAVETYSCDASIDLTGSQEAKRLCGGALTIYPYHGGNRSKDPSFLSKFDIVVTTYGVVQVPRCPLSFASCVSFPSVRLACVWSLSWMILYVAGALLATSLVDVDLSLTSMFRAASVTSEKG